MICTSAPALDERLEARRVALEGGAALRVGEQHAVAAGVEVETIGSKSPTTGENGLSTSR